jgi:hypothetical protein
VDLLGCAYRPEAGSIPGSGVRSTDINTSEHRLIANHHSASCEGFEIGGMANP